jgi:hypothetical protein
MFSHVTTALLYFRQYRKGSDLYQFSCQLQNVSYPGAVSLLLLIPNGRTLGLLIFFAEEHKWLFGT